MIFDTIWISLQVALSYRFLSNPETCQDTDQNLSVAAFDKKKNVLIDNTSEVEVSSFVITIHVFDFPESRSFSCNTTCSKLSSETRWKQLRGKTINRRNYVRAYICFSSKRIHTCIRISGILLFSPPIESHRYIKPILAIFCPEKTTM